MAYGVSAKTLQAAMVGRVKAHGVLRQGVVEMGGKRVEAVVHLGTLGRQMVADGSGYVTGQPLRLEILKSVLKVAPVVGSGVKVGELFFDVMEVTGFSAGDVAWVVSCMRVVPSA